MSMSINANEAAPVARRNDELEAAPVPTRKSFIDAANSQSGRSAVFQAFDAAIANLAEGLVEVDGQAQADRHAAFVAKLQAGLPAGLVEPDLDLDTARLRALHVQQLLGSQDVSVANSQPEALLRLFRD